MCSTRNLERPDVLQYFIDNSDVHVIVISESWLNDIHFQYYGIDGYQSFFSDRKGDKSGDGIAVYVKNSLSCELLECFDI